ncbi:MAG: hypothetical protein ACXAE3_08760 [Candidatus Kariarchaeaceae archaeon]|jgi:hypothetical protein
MKIPEIPNIPLEMPKKDNLYKKANYPYSYDLTSGVIRGKDFEQLLNIITTYYMDDDTRYKELEEQLGYHSLSNTYEGWDLQELSDFCRHLIQINRNHLGWDLVDIIDVELNKITIPGWRLPNFEFIEEFNNVLNQIHKVYFPERLLNVIATLLEKNKQDEIQFERDIKQQLHLWTIRDLWLLLNYLVEMIPITDDNEALRQIFNLISSKFEELIEGRFLSVKAKICVVLLYIDAITDMSKQTTLHSKQLIDRVWDDISELDYSEKVSFKYLLGAAYSIVGEQLFRQDTDFVTRKLFIDNFIQNYVLEEYDLGRWFADVLDYDVDELIFDLLIRGYSKTVPLLHKHAIELPESKTKDDVEHRIQQFNGVLAEILIYHLNIPDQITDEMLEEIVVRFHNRFKYDKTRLNMLELLFRVTSSSIFYNPEFSGSRKDRFSILTSYLLYREQDEFRSIIFEMDYQLNSNQYDIGTIYREITGEVKEVHSLILSNTFENAIIQKVAAAIEYLDLLETRNDLYVDIAEITIQFMLTWLQEFSRRKSDFKEALLLFSPMINILFHGMIRYYYENNYPKKAFLSNLNLYSFMNYFTTKIQSMENINFHEHGDHHIPSIGERYREITEKFNIRDILQQTQIKEMIIDTRQHFKDTGLTSAAPTGNLVEDALIHGYLDEISRLETFIGRDFTKEEAQDVELMLLESGIYQEGNIDSKYRFERIGHDLTIGEVIPVPLFKNVHRLAIATELFDLKTPVSEMESRNEKIKEKYIETSL